MLNKLSLLFVGMILVTSIIPSLFSDSFAQENPVISPRHQWKTISSIDEITCKEGLILLQKNNGAPSCVSPTAYLKLVDRGYGMFDSSIMMNRPVMMNNLMPYFASNDNLMQHWHTMMRNNPTILNQTITDWIMHMKNNPKVLTNIMGPMTSDPQLRDQMIEQMRNHPHMEDALKKHPRWMESVHRMPSGMGPQMGQGMQQGMNMSGCPWCPNFEDTTQPAYGMKFANPDRMMNMMHNVWTDPEMYQDMHNFMLQNPSHMADMADQMMDPMLGYMMDDPQIRLEMIDLMLEHSEFMNSLRHENLEGK